MRFETSFKIALGGILVKKINSLSHLFFEYSYRGSLHFEGITNNDCGNLFPSSCVSQLCLFSVEFRVKELYLSGSDKTDILLHHFRNSTCLANGFQSYVAVIADPNDMLNELVNYLFNLNKVFRVCSYDVF